MAFIAPKHEGAKRPKGRVQYKMPCIPRDHDMTTCTCISYPMGIATIDEHRALENKDR